MARVLATVPYSSATGFDLDFISSDDRVLSVTETRAVIRLGVARDFGTITVVIEGDNFGSNNARLEVLEFRSSLKGSLVRIDQVDVSARDADLVASALQSKILGGADLFDGSGGKDFFRAEGGNDRLIGRNGGDTLFGGEGDDNINGGGGFDSLIGGGGNDVLFGGGQADSMRGDFGADRLFGGSGSDNIGAGAGADRVFGGGGFDTIRGGGGNDFVNGDASADRISGMGGADTLIGGAGKDFIGGGPQNDRLIGGGGDDTLKGGKGADTFVFRPDGSDDTVLDFSDGDLINVAQINAIRNFTDLVNNHLSQDGDDAVIRSGGTVIVLEDVDISSLNAGDFIF